MLNSLAFHNIVSVTISQPRHHSGLTSGCSFSVRDIVITDKDGKEFTVEIFSHLDRIKIMEPSCNYDEMLVAAPEYAGEVD